MSDSTPVRRCTWKVRHGLEALTKLSDDPTADRFEADARAAARAWIADMLRRWRAGETRSRSKGRRSKARR